MTNPTRQAINEFATATTRMAHSLIAMLQQFMDDFTTRLAQPNYKPTPEDIAMLKIIFQKK